MRTHWLTRLLLITLLLFVSPAAWTAGGAQGISARRAASNAVTATGPSITSLSSERLAASAKSQTVLVYGTGFQNGLTLVVTPPLGRPAPAAVVVQDVSSTAFQMTVTLNGGGTWRIQVTNPDGGRSNSFSFSVQSGPFLAPAVQSVAVSASGASLSRQTLWVVGTGFWNGLNVTVISPRGPAQVLSGASVMVTGEGTLQADVLLDVPGTWTLFVTNPDGQQSDRFSFQVGIGTAVQLHGIGPLPNSPPPIAVWMWASGRNFQEGLTLTVVPPVGDAYTLSGDAIRDLTEDSFRFFLNLDMAGIWRFSVTNPDGRCSETLEYFVGGQRPWFRVDQVGNAANFRSGGVSPGEIVALVGGYLGPEIPILNSGVSRITGLLPTNLGNVSVTFDGTPAPLFYVSRGQINLQVPYEIAGQQETSVIVTYGGAASDPVTVPVFMAHPGVFIYHAAPLITNSVTGEWISDETPIARGSYITLWISGAGLTNPPVATGAPAPVTPLSYAIDPHAWLDGSEIEVAFAGLTPGMVGLTQVNLRIPEDAPTGPAVPLRLTINGTDVTGSINSPITVAVQ